MIEFYKTLFNDGEHTCFAKHPQGTKVRPVDAHDKATGWGQYICLNPLDPYKDNDPTEEYHDVNKPRRADANVVSFRNILIEFDDIPLEKQIDVMEDLGLDYSTCVYSGGKSLHFVLSLDEECKDKEEYDFLVYRLYKAINFLVPDVIDNSVKNASRLTRIPNAIRDNGIRQDLLSVKGRVSKKSITNWIQDQIGTEPQRVKINPLNTIYTRRLSIRTRELLMTGTEKGSRNQQIFVAACDYANCDYHFDEAVNDLLQITDLDQSEVIRTVKSGYRKVGK